MPDQFQYYSLTQAEQDATIADTIHGREQERHSYAQNVAVYEELLKHPHLKDLPEVWPPHLAKHRNSTRDQIAAALDGEDHDLAQRLSLRDRVKHLLKTERVELIRSELYHEHAVKLIPPERLKAALALKNQQYA